MSVRRAKSRVHKMFRKGSVLSKKKGGYKASNRMPKRALTRTAARPKRGAQTSKPFIRTKVRGRYI